MGSKLNNSSSEEDDIEKIITKDIIIEEVESKPILI